jgi:hypothetical protein
MTTRPTLVFSISALMLAMSAIAAETPKSVYLERAQTQASGAQIRSYGVPTTDLEGKVLYWDVTVDLTVNDAGKPVGNATVTAVKQPKVRTNLLVPGTYTDNFGAACTLNTAVLGSGRQEASGTCKINTSTWNFSIINGDISGHPFELQLLAAGIDQIPDYRDYNWGIDGSTSNNYGGCFSTNYVIAARQVGPQIVVTRYGFDNIGDCGNTLTKTP